MAKCLGSRNRRHYGQRKLGKSRTPKERERCFTQVGLQGQVRPRKRQIFKARLVARGFTQRYGVDFSKTFTPALKQANIRLIFVTEAIYGCKVHHFDFPQAYLNARGTWYGHTPLCRVFPERIIRAQTPGMLWHDEADKAPIKLALQRGQLDPCMYNRWDAHRMMEN